MIHPLSAWQALNYQDILNNIHKLFFKNDCWSWIFIYGGQVNRFNIDKVLLKVYFH